MENAHSTCDLDKGNRVPVLEFLTVKRACMQLRRPFPSSQERTYVHVSKLSILLKTL